MELVLPLFPSVVETFNHALAEKLTKSLELASLIHPPAPEPSLLTDTGAPFALLANETNRLQKRKKLKRSGTVISRLLTGGE